MYLYHIFTMQNAIMNQANNIGTVDQSLVLLFLYHNEKGLHQISFPTAVLKSIEIGYWASNGKSLKLVTVGWDKIRAVYLGNIIVGGPSCVWVLRVSRITKSQLPARQPTTNSRQRPNGQQLTTNRFYLVVEINVFRWSVHFFDWSTFTVDIMIKSSDWRVGGFS